MKRFLLLFFCFSFFSLSAQDSFDEDCNLYVFNATPLVFEIQIQEGFGIWKTLKNLTVGSFSNNDFSKLLKSSDFQYGKFRFFESQEGTYADLRAPGSWFITRPLSGVFDQKCAPLEIQGPNSRKFFGAVVRNCSKSMLHLFRNKRAREKKWKRCKKVNI